MQYAVSRHRSRRWRSGFTLTELLVVTAIAAIIASLIAAAAIYVLRAQRVSSTQTMLTSLNQVLERQWSYVIQQASHEPIPQSVYVLAGASDLLPATGVQNVERRARVIWVKLRLKQEFPKCYSEALYPGYVPGLPPALQSLPTTDLPGLATFTSLSGPIRQAGIGCALDSGFAIKIPAATAFQYPLQQPEWIYENAACLLLSLQQRRGGIEFREDSLGTFVKTIRRPINGAVIDDGLKRIVDIWDVPIVLYRYPFANPLVDSSFPATSAGLRSRDPLDPDGLLLDPSWTGGVAGLPAKWTSSNYGVYWFEQLCHPIHDSVTGKVVSRYMPPVLTSAGSDNKLGYVPMQVSGSFSPFYPELMDASDPNVGIAAGDNIFNFKP